MKLTVRSRAYRDKRSYQSCISVPLHFSLPVFVMPFAHSVVCSSLAAVSSASSASRQLSAFPAPPGPRARCCPPCDRRQLECRDSLASLSTFPVFYSFSSFSLFYFSYSSCFSYCGSVPANRSANPNAVNTLVALGIVDVFLELIKNQKPALELTKLLIVIVIL